MPAKRRDHLDDTAICPGGTTLTMRDLAVMKEKVQASGDVDALADFLAVSAHLNKMKLQGVLKTRRDAQMIYYSIADKRRMKHLASAFRELRQAIQEK